MPYLLVSPAASALTGGGGSAIEASVASMAFIMASDEEVAGVVFAAVGAILFETSDVSGESAAWDLYTG